MHDDGVLRPETAVRFERILPGPIERVWSVLTSGEHLAVWFGGQGMRYVIEPVVGGTVSLADGHIRGVVTQWRPPRCLAYSWNVFQPGETVSRYPESYVTFALEPAGDQVRLVLTHRPIGGGFEAQTLMGWHAMLDMLGALLRGEPPEPRATVVERHRARYGVGEIKR